jgi:hypothetical protein
MPTPILTVYDDGSEDGESIRIRKEQFVIGRAEGDLVIPHDSQMSSRHAELRQTVVRDKLRWTLVDLKSTNGTYVRIGHAVLEHGQEFILGRSRFRFENPPAERSQPKPAGRQSTRPWQNPATNHAAPAVVELTADGSGPRVLLARPEIWLGKDAGYCQLAISADPFVSARHARIRRDEEGRWILENNKSVNGVWLRIEQIAFKGTCRFLLGEQQFMVRVPG